MEDVMRGGDYDILINATPLGVVNEAVLIRDKVVMDVVHVPIETQFLRQAKANGCVVVPGYRMWLHQAILQFEMFTCHKAPFEVMERAALEYLAVSVTN